MTSHEGAENSVNRKNECFPSARQSAAEVESKITDAVNSVRRPRRSGREMA